MDNQSISISQALNHIQSWLNAGEFDKVIQGCTEILELEPANQRALALLKIAEERRHSTVKAETSPKTEPRPEPQVDPLAHLQVENTPSRFDHETEAREPTRREKRQFFLAMLIPAVLVVLVGGILIWSLAGQKRDDLLSDNGNDKGTVDETDTSDEIDTTYLKENDERIDEMTKMAEVIEAYRAEHKKYPTVDQIETVLKESGEWTTIPVDPRQGDIDRAGKKFGYVYAVYPAFEVPNKTYILSAIFEDSKGFGYEWTTGAPTQNHPDYRDIDEDHATFIGDEK